MIDTLAIFKNRVPDFNRLLANGFAKSDGGYLNSYELLNGEFEMEIFVSDAGKVSVKVFDAFLREEYVLVHMPGAGGGFVGTVTAACEEVLVKIAERCFYYEVFKTEQAKQIMEYAEKTYGDELEFLWSKLPDNAILRRKDTQKWYAAFLKVPKTKLGLDGSEIVEILDLRALPEEIEQIVDGKRFFGGYHMNKKHWYTICLNGSVPICEILSRIDASYQLTKKK